MKFIILLSCCSFVVSKVSFTDDYEKRIQSIIDECQKDPATQASEAWLKDEPLLDNLEGEGSHIFCRLKKVGSLKENGDIDRAGMEKDLKSGMDDDKAKIIMEKCGIRTPGSSPEKSAIDNFRCVLSTFKTL